jgi:deoxyribose-phosphate aldolase
MTALARLTARLEHRLTLPTDSLADLDRAVALVTEHELSALIVSPWLVRPARRLLGRSPVSLATIIGGDHGGEIGAVKAYEASRALEHGAVSLDCVLNAGGDRDGACRAGASRGRDRGSPAPGRAGPPGVPVGRACRSRSHRRFER